MNRFFLKMAARLHNFSYEMIKIFATRANNGINPKHRIMNYHQFFTDNVTANDTVLDIGCGNGLVAYDVAKKAKRVTAVDMDLRNIKKAKGKFSKENITYLCADATAHSFQEKFDIIILSNVLEHIEKRTDFLKKVKNLSKTLLIRIPMMNRDWVTPLKKELGIEWRLDNTHYTEYTLQSFLKELDEADLKADTYSVQFGEIWAVVSHKI